MFFCIRTTWNGSCSSEHKTIPYGSQTQKTEQRTTSTQRHSPFDTYRTPNPEKGISQYLPSLIVGSQRKEDRVDRLGRVTRLIRLGIRTSSPT